MNLIYFYLSFKYSQLRRSLLTKNINLINNGDIKYLEAKMLDVEVRRFDKLILKVSLNKSRARSSTAAA